MQYLFGDSTESKLDFDYLAFLRDVIDCAVVLLECEVVLAATVERWRTRQVETDAVVAAVDEFGKRANLLVGPVAQEQAGAPVGRCAASVAAAIQEAVERESSRVRSALAGEREEMDREDQRVQARAKGAVEKLLRAHDLPGAEKSFEVTWTGASVKALMRERTGFGIEAVLALDIPSGSVLGPDLRVDRIAEGVEVHTREGGGGWLKKSDKLVAHKLGRYLVTGVTVGTEVTVRLRAAADAGTAGFTIIAHGDGELTVEPAPGGQARELVIDDRSRPVLRLFADKLEAAVRALEDSRGGLASLDIDGKPLAEHGHPQVLAERFVVAMAPTVHRIARHSRSPGELVLRRLLGDNRREEVFVSVAELTGRYQGLPPELQDVFAPLQLGAEPPPADPKSAPVPMLEEVRSAPTRTPLSPPAADRSAPIRTSPPFPGLDRPRPVVPLPDRSRGTQRPAPVGAAPPVDSPAAAAPPVDAPAAWEDEDNEPTVMKPAGMVAGSIEDDPEVTAERPARKRTEDAALARTLDPDEEPSPSK